MAMKNVVRLDLISSGTHVRTFMCDKEEGLEKGYLLEIKGKSNNAYLGVDPDYECYKVELANADSPVGQLLIHTSVANQYDERLMETDFVLQKGKVGRGHMINRGDIYTIPASLVAQAVEVNDYLKLTTGGKMDKALSATDSAIAVVEAKEDIVVPYYDLGKDAVQQSLVVRFL